jgi:iron complex transport system ATP-binding protein
MLEVSDIRHAISGRTILDGISASFAPGRFHVIVGPNGSGKSTFLKVFSGELRPRSGEVRYDGTDVFSLEKKELARIRSVMSQQPELQFPLRVYDIVMMGRYPHFGLAHTRHDEGICGLAMEKAGVTAFADRDYLTLSGGEQQRVQFARALAQIWEPVDGKPRFLFLDEAVSHLDLKYQHQVLSLALDLCRQGVTVIAILHDLNLSITYADRILFLNHGRVAHDIHDKGEINRSIIKEVFDVEARVIDSGLPGRPVIVF